MFGYLTRAFALACAGWLVAGCSDPLADPVNPAAPPALAAKPGAPGAASDRLLYQVRLGPENGSRSHGVMLIEIVGGYLTITVHAAGLEPGARIPQHIHEFATCEAGGRILINLDDELTVRGEAPGTGEAYPRSNRAGVMNYYASRSLTDLLAAVNTYLAAELPAPLTSVEDLLAWLDLEDRNAHMHVASGPPFPAVNCGEIERLN